ncbi:hypothetical protein N9Y18_01210 [Litoricolaceae bacterium]|nr:hypothetical protein [Litorivicinaceae bacterium]
MKNNNALVGALVICVAGCVLALPEPAAAQTDETHDNYAFMSAQDLYDALSQESQVALGYLLGIVDAKKGLQSDGSCYTVPWQSDADELLVSAYLEYWPDVADFSLKAPDALIHMMQKRFPCHIQ